MDLNTIWFGLIGALFIGYAILDGFDFGVGILSLFGKDDKERRIYFNAIGPVWDGNEVWLITAGGALFAAFPVVYATVFSGFYLALMLLLVALIFRAVSFEFRSKVESKNWRRLWDLAFGFGSLLSSILLGVAFGNILSGVPIDSNENFVGTFLGLLNPYSIGIGILTTVLFIMHGAIYLTQKTDGELRNRCQSWSNNSWILFVILYVVMTLWTWISSPYLFEYSTKNLLFYVFLILILGTIVYLPIPIKAEKYNRAFFTSSLLIVGILSQSFLGLYPRIVPSSLNLEYSLTIYNSASSQYTLNIMLIITLIGMPLVIAYSIFIHRVFRGKVEITEDSY